MVNDVLQPSDHQALCEAREVVPWALLWLQALPGGPRSVGSGTMRVVTGDDTGLIKVASVEDKKVDMPVLAVRTGTPASPRRREQGDR